MPTSEFRVYNKINSSCFDLVGHNEPNQTKGLGYLLARSRNAMRIFLTLVFPQKEDAGLLKTLLKSDCIVDCESFNPNKDRADVVVRFYDDRHSPLKAIIVEAKSTKSKVESDDAAEQLERYRNIPALYDFTDKLNLVTLTRQITVDSDYPEVKPIAWQELLERFYFEIYKTKTEDRLLRDYLNYITNIQGTMNFYEIEVLSLPAGKSIAAVVDPECAIYECPVEGRQYKVRGETKALFFAFRKNGGFDKLYKIEDVISLRLDKPEDISAIAEEKNADGGIKYPGFSDRINRYLSIYGKGLVGRHWVFLINNDESIDLPYPVRYENCRGMTGSVHHKLKEVIAKPLPGQKEIIINKKNNPA